jgi:hypothetical protein
VHHCPECQRHAPYSKFASNEIQLLPPVWPSPGGVLTSSARYPQHPETTLTQLWRSNISPSGLKRSRY